jgi:hypothetical protein
MATGDYAHLYAHCNDNHPLGACVTQGMNCRISTEVKLTFGERVAALTRIENAAERGEQWAIERLKLLDEYLRKFNQTERK